MLISGIVDALTVVADATGPSTTARILLAGFGVTVWNGLVVGQDDSRPSLPAFAWVGVGGVTRCWALRNQAPASDGVWSLVFLWLFGCWIVDASIFVAVLLRMPLLSPFGEWGGVSCFCCVCVCGDKL